MSDERERTINKAVTLQARYTARLLYETLIAPPLAIEPGSFTDSDYDHVTNALDAMSAIMAFAYEEVPIDENVLDAGSTDGVKDALESLDD